MAEAPLVPGVDPLTSEDASPLDKCCSATDADTLRYGKAPLHSLSSRGAESVQGKHKLLSGNVPMTSMRLPMPFQSADSHDESWKHDSTASAKATEVPNLLNETEVAATNEISTPAKDAGDESDEGRESSISLSRLVDPSDDAAEAEDLKPSTDDDTARGEPAKLAARTGKLNEDARKLAVAYAIHSQLGCRRVAKDLDIPLSSVKRYLREFKVSESNEEGDGGTRRRKIPDEQMAEIKWWVEHFPRPSLEKDDKDQFAKKRKKEGRDASAEEAATALSGLGAMAAAAGAGAATSIPSAHSHDKESSKAGLVASSPAGGRRRSEGAAGNVNAKASKYKPDFPPEGSFAYRVLDIQFNTSTAGTTSDKFGFLEMLVAFCDEEHNDVGAKWVSLLEMGHGHYDFLLYDLLKDHGVKVDESSSQPGRVLPPDASEVAGGGGARHSDPTRRKKIVF